MGKKIDKTGRSKARKHDTFVALELFILHSDAWGSLSLAARQAYIEIAALYDQSNNGNLALSARQLAERLPISRATGTRAFQELTEKGFIAAVRPSGFNMKTGERRATEWRLTRFRCDVTGALPTKDFMKWKPGKAHFAASPESHLSFTTEPPKAENGQICAEVALSRSRPAILSKHDGFTTGPLLDSTIGGAASEGTTDLPSQPESSSPSPQPESPKAKPASAAHLLQTNLMKRQARLAQGRPS